MSKHEMATIRETFEACTLADGTLAYEVMYVVESACGCHGKDRSYAMSELGALVMAFKLGFKGITAAAVSQ